MHLRPVCVGFLSSPLMTSAAFCHHGISHPFPVTLHVFEVWNRRCWSLFISLSLHDCWWLCAHNLSQLCVDSDDTCKLLNVCPWTRNVCWASSHTLLCVHSCLRTFSSACGMHAMACMSVQLIIIISTLVRTGFRSKTSASNDPALLH